MPAIVVVRSLTAAVLASAVLWIGWLAVAGIEVVLSLKPDSIQPDQGHAFAVPLREWASSRWVVVHSDSSSEPTVSSAVVLESGKPLGPPHSVHDDIRALGAGRYSHWNGWLYLSTSDNSDPRASGRRYEVRASATPTTATLSLATVAGLLAIVLERRRIGRALAWVLRAPGVRWLSANVLPGLVISLLTIGAVAGIGELYLRARVPFVAPTWPSRFDPDVGWTFEPGAEVRHTNYVDFWAVERVNSLGFLDHEPSTSGPGEGCQVAIIGDSFVEAAQVTNADKVQSVLVRLAAERHPEWRLTASAFGYSGTGQLNQLPFYDKFVRPQSPSVVVLVVVSNDLANNSTWLEAIRNGWHPLHPPRLFARRDRSSGQYVPTAIEPEWRRYILPSPEDDDLGLCRLCRLHARLTENSLWYRWVSTQIRLQAPGLLRQLEPDRQVNLLRFRRETVAAIAEANGEDARWEGDIDMDSMFYEEHLPPVFQEAVAATGFALDEFLRRTRRDGAALVLLAASEMVRGQPERQRRYFDRLKALAAERGIPLVEQLGGAVGTRIDPSELSFRRDSHWSPRGHEVAARALLGWLERESGACPR